MIDQAFTRTIGCIVYFSHLFAMNDENLDVHMRTLFSCFTLFILATIH